MGMMRGQNEHIPLCYTKSASANVFEFISSAALERFSPTSSRRKRDFWDKVEHCLSIKAVLALIFIVIAVTCCKTVC